MKKIRIPFFYLLSFSDVTKNTPSSRSVSDTHYRGTRPSLFPPALLCTYRFVPSHSAARFVCVWLNATEARASVWILAAFLTWRRANNVHPPDRRTEIRQA